MPTLFFYMCVRVLDQWKNLHCVRVRINVHQNRSVDVCDDEIVEQRGRGTGGRLLQHEGEPAIRSLDCEERANILRQNAGGKDEVCRASPL